MPWGNCLSPSPSKSNMENRHYHASSCCLHFGKMVKPERFPVVKWARIQFKLDIVLPLPARPQVKTSHVPIGEYEYECLLPGWQAASWALVPHCFTGFVLLPKWSVPNLAHCSCQLLHYTGTGCFAELQVTASAR